MIEQAEINAFGQDKVARYGWIMESGPGRFELINKRLLHVNVDDYQREHTRAKALELASKWSWIACGALIVACRDGKYWVVDGQHRKVAADKRSDIKELPCMVYDIDSIKEEAVAFLAANTNRKPVSAVSKFKAQVASGNKTAKLVLDVISSAGLRIATASKEVGDFKSVSLAMDLAERDENAFSDVMHLAGELCADARSPLHQKVLAGLYYIITHIEGGAKNDRLYKRIKQVGMKALMEGATKAHAYYGKGGAKVFADGMLNVINTRLQTRFEFSA